MPFFSKLQLLKVPTRNFRTDSTQNCIRDFIRNKIFPEIHGLYKAGFKYQPVGLPDCTDMNCKTLQDIKSIKKKKYGVL